MIELVYSYPKSGFDPEPGLPPHSAGNLELKSYDVKTITNEFKTRSLQFLSWEDSDT
jgi:hypothetical protein